MLKPNFFLHTTWSALHKHDWSVKMALGGYSQKNWVGVRGPLPKAPTPFMTKICDIPYRIYDLTKNSNPIYDLKLKSRPCFRLALELVPKFRPMLNYRKQNLWRVFLLIFFSIIMKKCSFLKNIPISRPECKKHTLFKTKMAKIS